MQHEKVYFLLCIKWLKWNYLDKGLKFSLYYTKFSKDNLADAILV